MEDRKTHHPVLERLGHTPNTSNVPRVKVCRESEFGIVGELDYFFLGFEFEDRRNGAKDFFFGDGHVGGHSGD